MAAKGGWCCKLGDKVKTRSKGPEAYNHILEAKVNNKRDTEHFVE